MAPLLSLYAQWPARRKLLAALLLLGPVAYCTLFYQLGARPVAMWDESRLATNAAEMLRNGNWLVTHFGGRPDLWNTKPPLLIWAQALLFQLLGFTPLALRLPSALAALGTVALLAWFADRVLRAPLLGLCSALVLLTTSGYIDWHVTRSGDYDSLLVLLVTWYSLSYFRYLEEGRRALLWQTGLGLALAVLTKGVASALVLPCLLLYTLLTGRLPWLLRQRAAYAALAGVLLVAGGYYGLRELAAPGYLEAVYQNELGGRLLVDQAAVGETTWTWYLDQLITDELLPWLYLLPVGLLGLLWPGQPPLYRRLALFIGLFVGCFLAVLSAAATKYFWYEAPLYPFCALLAGAGLALLAELLLVRLLRLSGPRARWALPALVVLLAGVLYGPLGFILDETEQLYTTRFDEPDLQFGRYLALQAENNAALTRYYLLSEGKYNATAVFYRTVMAAEHGHLVRPRLSRHLKSFRPAEVVVVCNPVMRAALDSAYVTQVLYEAESCATLQIQAVR